MHLLSVELVGSLANTTPRVFRLLERLVALDLRSCLILRARPASVRIRKAVAIASIE